MQGEPVTTAAGTGSGRLVVTDARQAKLLVDRQQLDYLAPFVGREASATEAAAELRVDLDHMSARIRRLVAVGLLTVERVRPRRGRPVKLYRAVADEFFIPLDTLSFERDVFRSERWWHRRFLRSLTTALVRHLAGDRSDSGALVRRDDSGHLALEPADGDGRPWDLRHRDAPVVVFEWHSLRLPPEAARRLQRDLLEVLTPYREHRGERGDEYVVGVLMAPTGEPADRRGR